MAPPDMGQWVRLVVVGWPPPRGGGGLVGFLGIENRAAGWVKRERKRKGKIGRG